MVVFVGVQPFFIDSENNVYLLLGYEEGRGYSSFGGKPEGPNMYQEALRELREETHGLFDHLEYQPSHYPCVDTGKVIIFPYQLPESVLSFPEAYNNITKYLYSRLQVSKNSGLFEKKKMKWFLLKDLIEGKESGFSIVLKLIYQSCKIILILS